MPIDFIDELKWRGLFHQCTDEEGLRKHLADPANNPRRAYAGFDPTADSLTIGNLVPIMALIHFQRAGHVPIVVMGGGTGLIGDPSGKSAERQLKTREQVAAHVNAQRSIFNAVFTGVGLEPPKIVNNIDWLGELKYIDVLRDVGKHFSVNMMIQKESIRARLHEREHGISYTEFSYMILQAYDFLHLFDEQDVTIQLGGSDQFGNIVAGTDLIRRMSVPESARINNPDFMLQDEIHAVKQPKVFGLTVPLITKSDGGKFGKTESGAVWLSDKSSPDSVGTSPYDYFQFWLNASDADAIRFLKIFTLLSGNEIAAIEAAHKQNPGAREAQRTLAREATTLLHGKAACEQAEAAARALFSGEIADLPESLLDQILTAAPSSNHSRSRLEEGLPLLDLLVETGLARSRREGREFLQAGSVLVNGRRAGPEDTLTTRDLLHGRTIAIRRGKKHWHVTRWS